MMMSFAVSVIILEVHPSVSVDMCLLETLTYEELSAGSAP
jgi:hypothetical protein